MESTPQSAAAIRQAKILAKSAERLAKITGAAKGENRVISDAAVGIKSTPRTVIPTDDDPAEIDLASLDVIATNPTSATQTANSNSTTQSGTRRDPFAAIIAGDGLQYGVGSFGPGGFVPPRFPGMDSTNASDPFSQLLASMSSSTPFDPTTSTAPPQTIEPKTTLDRIFPVIHFLSMILLGIYAVFFVEPSRRLGVLGGAGGVDWNAWAGLSVRNPVVGLGLGEKGVGELAHVPIFYLFVTVELILQSSRLLLLRNRSAPPSILSTILPILSQFSPLAALALRTSFHYLSLLSICLNDLAVLVFFVGCVVVGARFMGGDAGVGGRGALVLGEEVWKARGEL